MKHKMQSPADLLEEAIQAQRHRMKGYEISSEALTFETLRAIDFAYCRELFPEFADATTDELLAESIRRRGVNAALRRVMPNMLQRTEPRPFRSNDRYAEQADGFLFEAGTLELAERQLGLVRAGVLDIQLTSEKIMGRHVAILTVLDDTAYREQIGYQGLGWLSKQIALLDGEWEKNLEDRHYEILPNIVDHFRQNHAIDDFPIDDADEYFQQWADLYLRRMPFADLLHNDDEIGGRKYSEYVALLRALSTLSAQRLCYAGLINADNPSVGIRNLVTGGSSYVDLVESLANYLDASSEEIRSLLEYVSLSPTNIGAHLSKGTPAFAPVVRTNEHFCVLPSYGLEMNPFVFLFNELRNRHEHDWFQLVNSREPRWINELLSLFAESRWACCGGVELKRRGKTVTDLDFVLYDRVEKSLLLFQLKWQQAPVGDERVRRSNGSNLVRACNKWVNDVHEWIAAEGIACIMGRCGLGGSDVQSLHTIVLGRYDAHFTGTADLDRRAVWSDWGNFLRLYKENQNCSGDKLAEELRMLMAQAVSAVSPETSYLLLPTLVLMVNPTRQQ